MYAVLGIIPFVGSTLAALVIAVTTLATAGAARAAIAIVAFAVYQQLENHVLQPVVQRRTIRMNPLLITVAALSATAA